MKATHANEIPWMTGPFYIVSRISRATYCLKADLSSLPGPGFIFLSMEPLQPAYEQLWSAVPDRRGGAVLLHLATGLVLTADRATGGLSLASYDSAKREQLFRCELAQDSRQGGRWLAINALSDWNQKINVYNFQLSGPVALYPWGGGADNELWQLVEEPGALSLDPASFRWGPLSWGEQSSSVAHWMTIDNRAGAGEITGHYRYDRMQTVSRRWTVAPPDLTTRTPGPALQLPAGLPLPAPVTPSGLAAMSLPSAQPTAWVARNTRIETETLPLPLEVDVTVPAGRMYRYEVHIETTPVSAPFEADLMFQSGVPGEGDAGRRAVSRVRTVTGQFAASRVSKTRVVIVSV